MTKVNAEHLIGLACLVLAGIIYVVSAGFPAPQTGAHQLTGPSFYPRVLAVILVLCGLLQILGGFKARPEQADQGSTEPTQTLSRQGILNFLTVCAAIIFFIYALEPVGFFVTTFVVLVALMWRFGVPWIKNLIFSVALVAFLYLIFGLVFTIYLPGGVLEPLGL